MRHFILLVLVLASAASTIVAQPQFPMQKGGISLRTTSADIGPGGKPVWLHVYCVPAGRMEGDTNPKPIAREDIGPGATIKTSPFFLELFDDSSGKLQRLNSIRFEESGDCNQLEIRWLYPHRHQGPVVLLRFGVGDVGSWLLLPFPHGLSAKPIRQEFGFSADAIGGCESTFDSVDRRGVMQIVVRCSYRGYEERRYRWNGRKFR